MNNYKERKNEIINTAEKLFINKGYSKTTVNDILQQIGIAKGTFYYYFKSKEEVMDAVIMKIVNSDVTAAKKIASNPELSVHDKLFQILMTQRPQTGGRKEQIVKQFEQPDNAKMQQKSLVQTILHLAPILTEVIIQGIKEDEFETPYPEETIEFLIASSSFIFDNSLFSWQPPEIKKRAEAFVYIMETILGAQKDSFDYVDKMLTEQIKTEQKKA